MTARSKQQSSIGSGQGLGSTVAARGVVYGRQGPGGRLSTLDITSGRDAFSHTIHLPYFEYMFD